MTAMEWLDFGLKLVEVLVVPAMVLVFQAVRTTYKGLNSALADLKNEVSGVSKHLAIQNGRIGRVEERIAAHLSEDERTNNLIFEELREVRRSQGSSIG